MEHLKQGGIINPTSLLAISILLIGSCSKEKLPCDDMDEVEESCVRIEQITDDSTSVSIFLPGDTTLGKGHGIKVNEAWRASGRFFEFIDKPGYFAVRLNTYLESGLWKENLAFSNMPLEKGCYTIENPGSFFHSSTSSGSYYTLDGDVLNNSYFVDERSRDSNKIEIISVDTLSGFIKGKASVSFIMSDTSNNINPVDPMYVRFFNLEFEGYLE